MSVAASHDLSQSVITQSTDQDLADAPVVNDNEEYFDALMNSDGDSDNEQPSGADDEQRLESDAQVDDSFVSIFPEQNLFLG